MIKYNPAPIKMQTSIKYLCAGGCRATAYKLYNDIKAYNERFCKMYRMATIDILEGMSYPYKIFKAH